MDHHHIRTQTRLKDSRNPLACLSRPRRPLLGEAVDPAAVIAGAVTARADRHHDLHRADIGGGIAGLRCPGGTGRRDLGNIARIRRIIAGAAAGNKPAARNRPADNKRIRVRIIRRHRIKWRDADADAPAATPASPAAMPAATTSQPPPPQPPCAEAGCASAPAVARPRAQSAINLRVLMIAIPTG